MTGVAWWSQTAASNANQDPSINFAEGQSPSSVNDSARSLMASAAKWRDDISGAIVTGGTSTAYTVASNQSFDSLSRLTNQVIAFTPHATSGGTATLSVDGLGAKPLRSAPSVELPAGTLVQGTPYVAVYNNSDAAFYLQGFFANPYTIPIGGFIDYGGSTAPNSSFVLPYGQAISRTTYATLFSLFGTTHGVGDGSTTFNVPDLRGRVIAGKDDMGGSAASRLTSSYFGGNGAALGSVGGSESHNLTIAQLAQHSHANTLSDPGHSHDSFGVNSARAAAGTISAGGVIFVQLNNGDDGNMVTDTKTTGITINNVTAGSGNAHNNTQPTIILNKLLRVI
ncbi:microcystin-dependent protein [Bradyrhizobium japonicum]|uniref:Microcystin-dependent protein n=1 Tax=Bradyrhizobium japonicum TaxID=375 RepID=A0ABV2RXL3_BRAJP